MVYGDAWSNKRHYILGQNYGATQPLNLTTVKMDPMTKSNFGMITQLHHSWTLYFIQVLRWWHSFFSYVPTLPLAFELYFHVLEGHLSHCSFYTLVTPSLFDPKFYPLAIVIIAVLFARSSYPQLTYQQKFFVISETHAIRSGVIVVKMLN